jgi:hypothetical protein
MVSSELTFLLINFKFLLKKYVVSKDKYKIDHYKNNNNHLNLTHHLNFERDTSINFNETSLITKFKSNLE